MTPGTSAAIPGPADTPVEALPAAEFEVLVNTGDVLDAYGTAMAHWNAAPARPLRSNASAAIRTLPYMPTALALVVIGMATLNDASGTGPHMEWVRWLTGSAFPLAVLALYINTWPRLRRRVTRSSTLRLLRRAWQGLEGSGIPTRFRLTAQTLEVQSECVHVILRQGDAGCVSETSRGFAVTLRDMIVPIPMRSLDDATAALVRAHLSPWGLPASAGQDLPGKSRRRTAQRFAGNLVSYIGIGFWTAVALLRLTYGAEPIRPAPAPEQVTLAVSRRTLLVAGEDVPMSQSFYTAHATSRPLHDSLGGHIRVAQARGVFYIERQRNGFTAYTLREVPRTSWGEADSVGLIPDDAQVSALPGDGALIEWARSAGDGTFQSCAVLFTYRDSVASAPHAYRHALRLQFCSATLTPSALASWMRDAADAVDTTFTDLARR